MRRFVFFIFAVAGVFGQSDDLDKAISEIFTTRKSNFFDDFDEVTSPKNDGFGATDKCGEGSDAGINKCVPYYNCDGDTKTIIPTTAEYDGAGVIDIRFGNNQCDDYLHVCCKIPEGGIPTTPTPVDPVTPEPVDQPAFCGIRNPNGIDFKITGNKDDEAEYGEFPWMAAILNTTVGSQPLVCGGSLIAPNVVLTGAFCVFRFDPQGVIVRVGEWDTQTETERYPYQERAVRRIIVHPLFNSDNLFNDYALLILAEPVARAPHIGTICLPPQGKPMISNQCFASGWGKDVFGKRGKYQVILKKIALPTVPQEECQAALRKTRLTQDFKLHESFTCAGGEDGKDTCTGDGGSPLVCPDPSNPNRYVQAGIVAWGIGCGDRGLPGVYADVPFGRSWIDEELRKLNIASGPYTI